MTTKLEIENVLEDELVEYAGYGKDPDNLWADQMSVFDDMGLHHDRISIEFLPRMQSHIDRYKHGEMDTDAIYMLLTKRQARVLGEFLVSVSHGKYDGEPL